MPSIAVRRLEDGDRARFNLVRSMTYRGVLPPPDSERTSPPDCTDYVAELDGVVVGGYTAIDLTTTRGEAVLRCAGVCAVAVLPEQRRTGIGAALMRDGLRIMRDQGFTLASLYAYREPFYRRFGYECCGRTLEITCPMDRLPKVDSPLAVRQLQPSEFHVIQPCYAEFARRYSGLNRRANDRYWPREDGEAMAVYAAGDPVEAYVIAKLDPSFWAEQPIKEFVWSTRDGYRAMLTLFRSLAINKTSVRWDEPGDSPFLAQHMDQGVRAVLGKPIMFRVLDVRKALSQLRPAESATFSVEIEDDDLPDNRGPWRVAARDGAVVVEPADVAEMSMDVRQFAQAFLGEPSLLDLARSGLVKVASAQALGEAAKVLPANPTLCLDSF